MCVCKIPGREIELVIDNERNIIYQYSRYPVEFTHSFEEFSEGEKKYAPINLEIATSNEKIEDAYLKTVAKLASGENNE